MAKAKRLLQSRRFAPLFSCQFFSAFNDNILKTALVFLILFRMGGSTGESLIISAQRFSSVAIFFYLHSAARPPIGTKSELLRKG
jgi:acyl-[acyl-carrier-protein]-phospholipid O-acyltransferase/long-chain-fatty-acid--[acyl-carrier-protein] ligase